MPPPYIGGPEPIYPWKTMEVGDSFLYPRRPDKDMASLRRDVASHASRTGRKIGRKFSLRNLEGEDGVRVWRVE